jgi:acetylornithine deacetylase/succinyl-diaminopimelate desuccinylase-like protein
MHQRMEEVGVEEVEIDAEGNVLGRIPGSAPGEPLVVAAHLDTVFPTGTDVTVRRRGDRLLAPGISDDGRGLAALLALARSLAHGPELNAPLLLAATVGEEGAGDLRGVRHLFRAGGPARGARAFISLDGAGLGRIVTRGVGSRRRRIVVQGGGGHSWVDFGTANPIHALGRLVAGLNDVDLPSAPPTTLTVARWSGGTSINAIPSEAWIEVEVRSEDPGTLDRLADRVEEQARVWVSRETAAAREGSPPLECRVESIGDRPAGSTPPEAHVVRAAVAATRAVGPDPELTASSTDANLPMSLGIPAVTMGGGGEAGRAHTHEEWYRNRRGPEGVIRALLTVLLLNGRGG